MNRPQFSLKTLAVLTTLLSVGCAILPPIVDWAWERIDPSSYYVAQDRRFIQD